MKNINEFIREIKIYSLDDIKKDYYRKTRGHWFDPDTMRFFKSRLSEDLFYSPNNRAVYFVSSEQGPDNIRAYSIREYKVDSGGIDTIGEFQQYKTLAQAKRAAKNLIKEEN